MSWQYRVFHDAEADVFYLGSAYFDENDRCDGFTDPASPWNETLDELKWTIQKFQEALAKPVIECDAHQEGRAE